MKTPKDPRHQARRLAISYIYSATNNEIDQTPKDYVNNSKELLGIKSYDKTLFNNITSGVMRDIAKLQSIIEEKSKDWELDSMHKVDVSILLGAIWEIKNTKTPPKVIVDEAVELAKEFGEKESARFVNGILAGVLN